MNLLLWSIAQLADELAAGLAREANRLDVEQTVYGLDALSELELHPVLERVFRAAGYGVFREQRYPTDRNRRRTSEGLRCDFVLTPNGRTLVQPDAAQTLFEPSDAVAVDESLWLEVKIVSQFTIEGANGAYSSQLLSNISQDLTKLASDPQILHAAFLVIMFVADEEIATHDLRIWEERCLTKGLPIAAPSKRSLPITNRLGNALIHAALFPVPHF